jgi:hypothetical protein
LRGWVDFPVFNQSNIRHSKKWKHATLLIAVTSGKSLHASIFFRLALAQFRRNVCNGSCAACTLPVTALAGVKRNLLHMQGLSLRTQCLLEEYAWPSEGNADIPAVRVVK